MTKLDRDCRITWLGHAAFRVDSPNGKVILIDPWLGNPKAPAGAREALTHVDVILPTHAHSDHLGDTVDLGRRFQPEIPCMYELHLYLRAKGLEKTLPMNKGGTQTVAGGIQVTMVSADHSAGLQDDELAKRPLYGGEPCGFVVELENGFRFYHAGDTNVFGDMKLIGELYRPDVALLPIGGLFTMGPREAAVAAKLLGASRVLPMHYGTFPPLAGTPAELSKELHGSGIEVIALAPGGTLA
jgi:L-ascorbate metabolism protein UlaG (beta-lactamase superfamily)